MLAAVHNSRKELRGVEEALETAGCYFSATELLLISKQSVRLVTLWDWKLVLYLEGSCSTCVLPRLLVEFVV